MGPMPDIIIRLIATRLRRCLNDFFLKDSNIYGEEVYQWLQAMTAQ